MDLAADSFLDQLLDLLGTLSNLSAQGHIKIAVELAQPIIEGLDGLIGVKKRKFITGVEDHLEEDRGNLKAGHRAIVVDSKQQLDPSRLLVMNNELYYHQPGGGPTPLRGFDFLLFSIDVISDRLQNNGWLQIPEISEAWRDVDIVARGSGSTSDSRFRYALESFRFSVSRSKELTLADRHRLMSVAQTEANKYWALLHGQMSTPPDVPRLPHGVSTDPEGPTGVWAAFVGEAALKVKIPSSLSDADLDWRLG